MATRIIVRSCTPFSTPEGNRGVVMLDFPYEEKIVLILKQVIHEQSAAGVKGIGGWLPDRKYWFWKRPYLELLETRLARYGVTLYFPAQQNFLP